MRVILALAFLLAAEASGQFVSYPAAASGAGSVVTNPVQYVTNSTFSSGTQGWYSVGGDGVSWTSSPVASMFMNPKGDWANDHAIFAFASPIVPTACIFRVVYITTNAGDRTFIIFSDEDGSGGTDVIHTNLAAGSAGTFTGMVPLISGVATMSINIAVGSVDTGDGRDIYGTYLDTVEVIGPASIVTNPATASGGQLISIGQKGVGVTHR